MSELFHIPVCYVEERPLISIKSVRAKINNIYNSKAFDFNDEELEDQDIKALKELIDYYGLNKSDDFLFSYANLLEIVASKNTRIPVGDGGVVISNRFVFDPSFFTYVTNFNSDAFYKIYADDNVLSDAELKEVGYNTSYIKTAIENHQSLIVEGCYVPFNCRKDFNEEYLSSIRFICLAMTDGFIDKHFDDIKKHNSDIESRQDDSGCTIESLKADNHDIIKGFQHF